MASIALADRDSDIALLNSCPYPAGSEKAKEWKKWHDNWHPERQQWLYVNKDGYLRFLDQNGEMRVLYYDYLRVEPGTKRCQYHLLNGQWFEWTR